MPAAHPEEFRRRAVELARLREKPIAQIAKDIGISESCLRRWMVCRYAIQCDPYATGVRI
jgi:transposase-like protein